MLTQTTVRPSVWIGCLACYNQGLLNGQWFHGGCQSVCVRGLIYKYAVNLSG